MTDGPLIVQSDKTLLLEVDHPSAEAAAGPSRRSPSSSAPPSTSTPTGSPRSACGTRAPPATTPSRSSTRCSTLQPLRRPARAARRRRRDDGPLRAAAAREAPRRTASCCARTDRPVLEEVLRHKKIAAAARRAHRRPTPSSCTRQRARPPQAGAAQARLAGRGPRRLRRRRGAPDRRSTRTAGTLRPYQQQAVDGFWHGGSGVVVLPCGAGKTLVGAGRDGARPRRPR